MKIPWKLFFQVLGATVVFQTMALFLWTRTLGQYGPDFDSFMLLWLLVFILLYWPVLIFALYPAREPVQPWRVRGAWLAISVFSAFIYLGFSMEEEGFAYLVWASGPVIMLVVAPLLALLGARLANALFVADLP